MFKRRLGLVDCVFKMWYNEVIFEGVEEKFNMVCIIVCLVINSNLKES